VEIKRKADNGLCSALPIDDIPTPIPANPTRFMLPSSSISIDPRAKLERRHHVHPLYRAKTSIRAAEMYQQASCQTFRHSFATRLLQKGFDLRKFNS
jgi:integrase